MKNKFLCLLALLCLLATLTTRAQTTPNAEDEFHQLYWTYRNRYKLYFTHIGNNAGDCVPISARLDFSTDNGWCDFPNGYIKYGDGTSQIGFYLGLLATEYKLLKDQGQPVQPTRNKLYYAKIVIGNLNPISGSRGAFVGCNQIFNLQNHSTGIYAHS